MAFFATGGLYSGTISEEPRTIDELISCITSAYYKQGEDSFWPYAHALSSKYFKKKDDMVNAFAALNYAHGWLDAGVKLGIFDVRDSKLFAGVDYEDHN